MIISQPINLGAIGSQIWTTTTPRNLTTMQPPYTILTAANQSLAASTTVNFTPAAATMRLMTIGVKAGAAGTAVTALYDGTTAFGDISTAAGQTSVSPAMNGSPSVFPRLINNDAVNPALYAYAGYDIV